MKLIRVAILSVICTIQAGTCFAGEKEEAKEAFESGVELFKEYRFLESVAEFRRANSLHPTWKINYNIGQCEAALKRYGLAIEAFEAYLSEGGDNITTERHDAVIKELEKLRKMVGIVDVKGPEGLDVFVDGVFRGTTPTEPGIFVSAGAKHVFTVQRDGEEIFRRENIVRGGLHLTLRIEDEPPDDSDGNAVVPVAEPDEPENPSAPIVEPEEQPDGLKPTAFWVGAGTTMALGISAMAMEFAIGSRIDSIRAGDDSLRSGTQDMQKVNYVLIGFTGAALVTTSVLAIMTDFEAEDERDDVALSGWTQGDGGGLILTGRF